MAVTVDVGRIVRDKLGRRARYVPRWVVSYVRRLIHEDWVNAFLVGVGDKRGTAWLVDCIDYLDAKLEVVGLDRLPAADGRLYTFVSNHPLGGMDGVALGTILGGRYGDNFRYLVNDLLMNLPGLAPLCVPINKTGKNGRDFPQVVDATFRSSHHVLMFPAGLCSRRRHGVIKDLPWKKTFITKSVATGRDIVPIYFEGCNSNRFYRVASLCEKLHIKFNLAMLLLPDELYKNCHKTFRIVIGEPMPITLFDRSRPATQWAEYVYDHVYALASELP